MGRLENAESSRDAKTSVLPALVVEVLASLSESICCTRKSTYRSTVSGDRCTMSISWMEVNSVSALRQKCKVGALSFVLLLFTRCERSLGVLSARFRGKHGFIAR